jgi:putative transcriptional regulator
MTENTSTKFEEERDIWQEVLDGVRQIKRGQYGRKFTVKASPVVEARKKIGLSQAEFARLLRVSTRTVQDWEQGRRKPSGPAESLIILAGKRPDVLREVFG